MLLSTAISPVFSACDSWILDVTLLEVLGEQALHITLAAEAGLGSGLILPLAYFPFLEKALISPEPACGWVAEGTGITSAVHWPALGERRTINQLHSIHFEHQMATMFAVEAHH